MKAKDKKYAGFTMVELVVVMIIVGILSSISVPVYRTYIQRARAQEGVALVGSVAALQRAHYAEHERFRSVHSVSYDPVLGVDVRSNKYFTNYTVNAAGTGEDASFEVITEGRGDASGITVTAKGKATEPIVIDVDLGDL